MASRARGLFVLIWFLLSYGSYATSETPPLTPVAVPTNSVGTTTQQLLDHFSFKGSARIRSEVSDKTDLVSNRSFTHFRVRTDFLFTPDPLVSLFFQPQFTKVMGDPAYVGASVTTNSTQDTSGNGYDTFWGVHQAYMDIHPNDWIDLKLGRQVLAYGDDLLIGAADWGIVARSFDAAKIRMNYGLGWSDFFFSKIKENTSTSPVLGGDKDFYGSYSNWKLSEWIKLFEFYALYLRDESVAGTPISNLWNLGFRIQSNLDFFDYTAKVNKQIQTLSGVDGSRNDSIQSQVEIGITGNFSFKPRIAVEGFYASKNYNQLYPAFHKWIGYADVLAMRNIMGFSLRNSANILPELKANLDFHTVYRAESSAPAYKLNGTTPLGSASGSTAKNIGNELDLVLTHETTKALTLSGGISLFRAGDYILDQFNYSNLVFYYMQLELKF